MLYSAHCRVLGTEDHISAILISFGVLAKFYKFEIIMERIPTSAEVDAQYKECIPEFPEKLDYGDTKDYVAIGMRRKPVMVCLFTTC